MGEARAIQMQLRSLLLTKQLAGLLDGPLIVVHIHGSDSIVQLHVANRIHLVVHV